MLHYQLVQGCNNVIIVRKIITIIITMIFLTTYNDFSDYNDICLWKDISIFLQLALEWQERYVPQN